MRDKQFATAIEKIVTADPRFSPEAYEFISDAVLYTTAQFHKNGEKKRHISGQELLEGIREYAISEFGPLAGDVLQDWGIHNSMGIGHIVFNMVDNQLLGRSEEDSIDDFKNGFDFNAAFSTPFIPKKSKESEVPAIDI